MTGADIEGPFYKENAPFRMILSYNPNLILSGKVLDQNGNVVKNAVLDFWQADSEGHYDNNGFNFRGKVKTDEDGKYILVTEIPGEYQISDDEFRCPHIHVKFSAEGYKPLTTQLYFAYYEHNETDRWFNEDRIIELKGKEGTFDFVVEKTT